MYETCACVIHINLHILSAACELISVCAGGGGGGGGGRGGGGGGGGGGIHVLREAL